MPVCGNLLPQKRGSCLIIIFLWMPSGILHGCSNQRHIIWWFMLISFDLCKCVTARPVKIFWNIDYIKYMPNLGLFFPMHEIWTNHKSPMIGMGRLVSRPIDRLRAPKGRALWVSGPRNHGWCPVFGRFSGRWDAPCGAVWVAKPEKNWKDTDERSRSRTCFFTKWFLGLRQARFRSAIRS